VFGGDSSNHFLEASPWTKECLLGVELGAGNENVEFSCCLPPGREVI